MKKKTLTIALALVLVVALAVGASYAYLTAQTGEVKNTFTVGKILDDPTNNFVLKEHEVEYNAATGLYEYTQAKAEVAENTYSKLAPKTTAPKDPFVKFTAAIESPAYLFVKVTDTTTGITAAVDTTNWTELKGDDLKLGENEHLYVYKEIISVGTHTDPYYILSGNQISVPEDAETVGGSLAFNGYLCQSAGFASGNVVTAAEAQTAYAACFAK